MTLPEIHPGQELDWLHSPRGGWGYVYRVPVRVIAVRTSGLVKIAAPLSTGGERVRFVKPESLQPRKTANP
jgi:hypothetical protein